MTRGVPLTLVAAVARNGVIGDQGRLPWHLPGDLAHFRTVTMAHPLLMGRRTFASIGRPLPGRTNIVVSRDPRFAPPGVTVAGSLADGLARADAAANALGADAILVIGGGELYRALIDDADALLITAVDLAPAGDTTFPPINPVEWQLVDRRGPMQTPGDSAPYSVERWARRRSLRFDTKS